MKRKLFDQILLVFLFLSIVSFSILFLYTTYSTKSMLIREKKETLYNEAILLSKQTLVNYITGVTSLDLLITRFNEFEDDLKIKVWYVNNDDRLVAMSYRERYDYVPNYLHELDDSDTLKGSFSLTGNFYNIFGEDMITLGIPIVVNETDYGKLILHTSIDQVTEVQSEMFTIAYTPFAFVILISFCLLAFVTSRVFKPLKKLNDAAQAYARGDFDASTEIKSKDEIGELANSLEYMAGELSKLDEYRKNFISNISHDFRSPLTSIKGYIEAMLDGTIPVDRQEKYLNIVLTETNRLTKLTSSLLELNSYDSAGLVLQIKEFDIVDIVRSTISTFEGVCDKKGIALYMSCHAEETLVSADKPKMQQVLYNLIDNAIKFSPNNSTIKVTITEKKEKLFVSVKDEGPGIEKDKQKHVWDRFYKSDSSRGKDKQGTGLGLSITKEIIKAHGENINLVSTEGAGSEFIFSIKKAQTTS